MLIDGMVSNKCTLECPEIADCLFLIGFLKGVLPTTLKKLVITDGQKLECLAEGSRTISQLTATTLVILKSTCIGMFTSQVHSYLFEAQRLLGALRHRLFYVRHTICHIFYDFYDACFLFLHDFLSISWLF